MTILLHPRQSKSKLIQATCVLTPRTDTQTLLVNIVWDRVPTHTKGIDRTRGQKLCRNRTHYDTYSQEAFGTLLPVQGQARSCRFPCPYTHFSDGFDGQSDRTPSNPTTKGECDTIRGKWSDQLLCRAYILSYVTRRPREKISYSIQTDWPPWYVKRQWKHYHSRT